MIDLNGFEFHPHPYQRETSEAAWESVKASGWAAHTVKQAYELLYHHGPLTLLELEHMAAGLDFRRAKGRSESTIVRRLYDLRDNGLADVTPIVRLCGINRKKSVTWDVTGNLAPKEKFKHISAAQEIAELKAEIKRLKALIPPVQGELF